MFIQKMLNIMNKKSKKNMIAKDKTIKKRIIKNRIIKNKKVIVLIVILLFAIFCFLINYTILHNSGYGNNISNSFASSQFIKNKTVMILVPHEDDDTNIAGSFMQSLKKAHDKVYIVYATNGDYFISGKTRITEAINAIKVLGYNKSNSIFLGYGDQLGNKKYEHIYNAPNDTLIKSNAHKTKTYASGKIRDFRTNIAGMPSSYTRKNYENDIKDVILKYRPDIIFAIDIDFHPDHRSTSLFFEEAMAQILKQDTNYHPTVFKGFAYNTAYGAKDDYYNINYLESTIKPAKNMLNNSDYELDMPSYNWNDRIRIPVDINTLAYTKRGSILNKVYSKYKSQKIGEDIIGKAINADKTFWQRKTTSLTYNAKIEVSSGNPKYLNDFKLVDSENIEPRKMKIDNCVWIPNKDDTQKTVKVIFNTPQDISSLSLYDNFSLNDNITKSTITFSDSSKIEVGPLNKNGSETQVSFDTKHNISYIEYKIDEYEGKNPGLCELEVYSQKQNETPQYIKIMLNNDNQSFIYKYLDTNLNKIPISIYSYPNQDSIKNINNCNIYVKKAAHKGNIEIKNGNIIINDRTKTGRYVIEANLKSNPKIYDDVVIDIPTKSEIDYRKFQIKYEVKTDMLNVKLSTAYQKVKKVYKIIKKIYDKIEASKYI